MDEGKQEEEGKERENKKNKKSGMMDALMEKMFVVFFY